MASWKGWQVCWREELDEMTRATMIMVVGIALATRKAGHLEVLLNILVPPRSSRPTTIGQSEPVYIGTGALESNAKMGNVDTIDCLFPPKNVCSHRREKAYRYDAVSRGLGALPKLM